MGRSSQLFERQNCPVDHPKGFGPVSTSELHVFCDASAEAIGLVTYLKQTNSEGNVSVSLVFGPSKVARRAATFIPRLELCAAVEAARIAHRVAKEFDQVITNTVYFSDSRIVLGYLSNAKRAFPRYVTSRVTLALRYTEPSQRRYIPSGKNPADTASRPHSAIALQESCWIAGSEFLRDSRKDLSSPCADYDDPLPEKISKDTVTCKTLITQTQGNSVFPHCIERYESWT